MGLNDTPNANRTHIGFFGARNAGKSSLLNAVTNQSVAVVSDEKGTTTDPVLKTMELLPLGPVTIIDTPGFDDTGKLGELRVAKTRQILNKTDIAVLTVDALAGISDCDKELISIFEKKDIPFCIAYNKADLLSERKPLGDNEIYVSALTGEGIFELKEKIARLIKSGNEDRRIVADLINPSDFVLLITPIDKAAPKGRLILPQQQTIRDILDSGATAIVTKENEIEKVISELGKKPALVICDSQVFKIADEAVPKDIPLTSFSILMARYKGFLETAVAGVAAIDKLKDGDTVVISEGCTHHRQCNDIGTVKIPNLLKKYTGKDLDLKFTSGSEFYDDLSCVSLVIHCGGCMITEREVKYRMKCAADASVPFTNYGIALAYLNGILDRSIEIFPNLHKLIERI